MEFFEILQNASIGHAGRITETLLDMMVQKDQKLEFLENCIEIFSKYIDQAKNEL